MKMRYETSLAEDVEALIQYHLEAEKAGLIEIIEGVMRADLDDDLRQQMGKLLENALESEVMVDGPEPSDIGVRWTINLEPLADWSGVSLDILRDALEAEVEEIGPVLEGVAGFAEFQQELAAEIEKRARRSVTLPYQRPN